MFAHLLLIYNNLPYIYIHEGTISGNVPCLTHGQVNVGIVIPKSRHLQILDSVVLGSSPGRSPGVFLNM